jgi:exodeoxyribonuclease VII small subunit
MGDGPLGPLTTITPWFSLTDMPRQPAPVAAPTPPRYEEALAELERLVQRMEDGQLPLDQLLDNYRRGAELLESCRARLAAIEEQVKVLEDGQLKPWISGASEA